MKQPPIYDQTTRGIRCQVTTSKDYLAVDVTINDKSAEIQVGFPIPIEAIRDAIQ